MKNKRVTPEQFAEFIAFKTGKNLTCPICGGLEHYWRGEGTCRNVIACQGV
nr:MAG TPA: Zinc-binding domain of primase-helicase [Caudoviricetes sp.]